METHEKMLYYVTKILQEYTWAQPNEYLWLSYFHFFICNNQKIKENGSNKKLGKNFAESFS